MAKKLAATGPVKARILSDVFIDGIRYEANTLILIDADKAAAYVETGDLDDSAGGVDYLEGQGAKAADHAAAVAAAEAAAAPVEQAP